MQAPESHVQRPIAALVKALHAEGFPAVAFAGETDPGSGGASVRRVDVGLQARQAIEGARCCAALRRRLWKTTLLGVLRGIYSPDAGTIEVEGRVARCSSTPPLLAEICGRAIGLQQGLLPEDGDFETVRLSTSNPLPGQPSNDDVKGG
jgi:hypothetical protein